VDGAGDRVHGGDEGAAEGSVADAIVGIARAQRLDLAHQLGAMGVAQFEARASHVSGVPDGRSRPGAAGGPRRACRDGRAAAAT